MIFLLKSNSQALLLRHMSRGAIHYADMPPGPTPLITGAGEKVTITAFPHEVIIVVIIIIIIIIIKNLIIINFIIVIIINITPLITGAGEKVTITAFPHEVTIILNFIIIIIIIIIILLIIIILIIVVVIILMQVHVSSILAIAQVEKHPLFKININTYHL